MIKKYLTYYRLSKEELQKVLFPTKEQIKSSFIAVTVVVSVVTLFLMLVDFLLSFIISSIIR